MIQWILGGIVGLTALARWRPGNDTQRALRDWNPRATGDASKDRFIDGLSAIARNVAPRFLLHPAVLLAQAALESGWGRSASMTRENALWGVKVGSYTPAEALERAERISRETGLRVRPFTSVSWGTHEETRDGRVQQTSSFRAYPDLISGAADYADLVTRGRYGSTRAAFVPGQNMMDPYKQLGVIWGSGYATSRRYIQSVASILEDIGAGPRPRWLSEFQERILAARDAGTSTGPAITWMMNQ